MLLTNITRMFWLDLTTLQGSLSVLSLILGKARIKVGVGHLNAVVKFWIRVEEMHYVEVCPHKNKTSVFV